MARLFLRLFRWLIFASVCGSAIHYILNHKSYVFSPKEIRRIGEQYGGQHPNQCASKIVAELNRKYIPHILPDTHRQWLTVSTSGLKGKMMFLHASITEYLAIIGSPLKGGGHAGIHWLNQTCHVLTGGVQRWKSGALSAREDFGPGMHFSFFIFHFSFLISSNLLRI